MDEQYFEDVVGRLQQCLRGDELFTCSVSAERSDFVRLSQAAVRQAGSVSQSQLSFDLIEGRRHAEAHLTLCGDLEVDGARIEAAFETLRERRAALPEDPHLLYATDVRSSRHVSDATLPRGEDAALEVLDAARGRDLVGLLAAGEIANGFANSLGQRNWHATRSFNLDYSFHQQSDTDPAAAQAIKGSHAGIDWQGDDLERRFERADEQLAALSRPARDTRPGPQRVYLAPAALADIMDMLALGGFGLRDHKAKTTPLLQLAEGEVSLDPRVAITENTRDGIAPAFQNQGFLRPDQVALVESGRYAGHLVSPRSAAEFDVETNGASDAEMPRSVDVAPGELKVDAVLDRLGTGVFISNLWYLNFSDRRACRTTGMTRFATFWVENGRIVAPIRAMRFDESVYRMLGEKLEGLTEEREMLLDPDTYGRRSTKSQRLPGVLVDDFRFTL